MSNLKQLAGMALALGVALLMACQESPFTPVDDLAPAFANGGRGGGGGGGGGGNDGTIPLSVTLTGTGVAPDGGGAYVHDVDGVLAGIDDTGGDLAFTINAPKRSPLLRVICFNFSSPIGTPVDDGPLDGATQICNDPLWNTADIDLRQGFPAPGVAASGSPARSRFILSPDKGWEYKIRFGAENIPPAGCETLAGDPITVTGVDTDGDGDSDAWNLDAGAGAAMVMAHRTKGNHPWVCVGLYTMPWSAVLKPI